MLSRLTAIALVALASFAGAMTLVPTAASARVLSTSHYFPEAAILDWSGERFTIIRIDSLPRYSDKRERLDNWMDAYPEMVDALQQAILENGEFADALRARSVQINNVGVIEEALNGNLVIYLR